MNQWLRRIRGAIGIGLTWTAAWFGAGILLARVPRFYSDLPFALLFAPLGFVTGVMFSRVLVGVERRRTFDRLSLSRFAGWGAVSGLLLSGIFVVAAALRGESLWGEFLVFGPPGTIERGLRSWLAGASQKGGALEKTARPVERGCPERCLTSNR